jgi:hypothetical protein
LGSNEPVVEVRFSSPNRNLNRNPNRLARRRLGLRLRLRLGKKYLFSWWFGFILFRVSTAVEIEAAIERLPTAERAKLRERLLERPATKPKTGAELAVLWRTGFHLTKEEADDFARDLEAARQSTPKAQGWESPKDPISLV